MNGVIAYGSRDDDYAFDDISAFDDNSLLLGNFDI